jgi:arylsulfatase A-like enzyme
MLAQMGGRPNIVFLLLDDYGWRDTGCYGSTFYETPCLDRLAASGLLFTDNYAACPVCSPTRASLLTGKYPPRLGVTDWIDWGGRMHPCRGVLVDAPYRKGLPDGEATIADALRAGGYQTWHVGKWHAGGPPGHLPQDHGFDVNVGGSEAGSPRSSYFAPWKLPGLPGDDVPPGTDLTDHLTDRAIELLRGRDASRPFFLNLWHYAVHTPIEARPELVRKYELKAQRLKLDQATALVPGERFPTAHKAHLCVQRRVVQSHPTYAAMVENTDRNIGRLLDALDAAGVADDTLVVFTSDNGGLSTSEGSPTCNLPLSQGKGWMHEGGTRTPLIVRWPGRVRPATVCREPVTSPDLYPTLLEAAGLPLRPSQHADGVSLLPLLRGEALRRGPLFWHYPHYGNQGGTPGAAVRDGDWKLIRFFEDERLELYNLAADPGETRNCAGAEPARAAAMRQRLDAWLQDVGAVLPQRAGGDRAP